MNTTEKPGEQNPPYQYPHDDPRPDQGHQAPGQPKPGAPNAPGEPKTQRDQSGRGEQEVR
jgi:hypothetical protein